MMKTNFEKVSFYNELIGNIKGSKTFFDKEAVEAQLSLIDEELDELVCGFDLLSILDIRDAIADVLVTVYGLAHRTGINADLTGANIENIDDLIVCFPGLFIKGSEIDSKDSSILLSGVIRSFASLSKACEDELIEEIESGIFYIIFYSYCLAGVLRIDADADFDIVHKSNISKFCVDENEVIETKKHYAAKGVGVFCRGNFPEVSVLSIDDQYDDTGKFYKKGKQLKSAYWKAPEFK